MAKKSKTKSKSSKPSKKGAAKPKKAAPKSTASKPTTHARAQAVSMLKFGREMINKFFAGFDDKLTAQGPGVPNHALWTYGHLASTTDWLCTMIDGRPKSFDDNWKKQFGGGSKPVNDLSVYPPAAEVKKHYEVTFTRLIAATERLNDAQLMAPCAIDSGGFASSKLDAIHKGAWHEGWHLGQLSDLRRALGMPGVF